MKAIRGKTRTYSFSDFDVGLLNFFEKEEKEGGGGGRMIKVWFALSVSKSRDTF